MNDTTFHALTEWARLLGWPDLAMNVHEFSPEEAASAGIARVTWYTSGSYDHICLQINELPPWHAAVYAIRYRLCTGWHRFQCSTDPSVQAGEALRLEDWLHRRWFVDLPGRRAFRQSHPECANYTWKRIRKEGPPYRAV